MAMKIKGKQKKHKNLAKYRKGKEKNEKQI